MKALETKEIPFFMQTLITVFTLKKKKNTHKRLEFLLRPLLSSFPCKHLFSLCRFIPNYHIIIFVMSLAVFLFHLISFQKYRTFPSGIFQKNFMKSLLWWWSSSATSPRQADSPGGTLCCGHLSHVCISPSKCKLSSNTPEIDERQQQGQSVERCHVSTSLESGLTPIITWVMLDSLCVLLVSALRSPLSNSKNQTARFETPQPSEKKRQIDRI